MNRITKLKERDFIWRMMNFVLEWDAESEAYTEDQMLFNLNELLDSKRVVLIDTGEFRPASSNLFTVLMLDYIWSWVLLRKRWERSVPSPDDGYEINHIIDEVGVGDIQDRIRELVERLIESVAAGRSRSPATPESGLVTIDIDDPVANVDRLADKGVVIRSLSESEAVRASIHAVNTVRDVDRLVKVLESEWD